ncbi:MAG: glucose 1-dehydrogenase [Gammaproteobacteria bacterium]|nr:glucose 1-dehydrogenase [Gammaproteobacteria bacterium]
MSAQPFDVSGRTALVTGASGGLGRHFALTLARHGARVVLAARRRGRLEALAGEIGAAGGSAHAVAMDVTDATSVAAAFAEAARVFAIPDVVVNNSGIAEPASVLDLEEDAWDRVLDTNLKGAWLVAREAGRRLREAGRGGSIINIVSILAFRVGTGMASYAASKAALAQLTRVMGLELARHGIRVNAIAPGYILSDMNREFFATPAGEAMVKRIPQRRLGEPADLDGALLLLASDASRFMTGSVITVDGGHLQSGL